ncbi:MAG: hypothetical protein A3B86_00050 [Candidatus Yanofskybacteria bacterium RIFCSPHIGHO2_02_FULL_38_22b]|uniref:Type II secretion system protein GspG C-terminal domain-containing protein n=1 Tax=Candidatus Yanofskybacteria bacterium RIFCSPHIGHO2_02_FULL_38_22b TaxID=1802673 RepID=A0A1F8F2S8_9BACT|nr:MAG: hypothetical protein A2816_00990 [Candidatus Yanofskybacteria bacterium RIFCSPHIGHO2_01_FULL_39_44]OGN06988.1 MAG: hypothetical protein A3B86_00050 [Candidatus Yanofskybacteria bacterium RIFCSPHIGHO2_02_FULL_38_22b]
MFNLKKFRNLASSKGFTLVELLVVIAIIGVLATLILLQLGVARQKARDARRVADINQVRSSLELYFDDEGNYPTDTSLNNDIGPGAAVNNRYLTVFPFDPLDQDCSDLVYDGNAGADFCYGYAWDPATSATRFHLWAELERSAPSALNSDVDFDSTGFAGTGAEVDANDVADETCASSTALDCIYDVGQTF